jgi:hypothetical protein
MSFGFDVPILDDSDSWAEASAAYQAGLAYARKWQADARTALVDVGEYPPAYQNEESNWLISYWSPTAWKGLNLTLDPQFEPVGQTEWGAFYRETVERVGAELLGPHRFSFVPEIGQPGPDGLSFVFRRPAQDSNGNEFIDVQISASVMLTPPPRRFTINLVRNFGERPLFGAFGGWEGRLGQFLPQPQPDKWWAFKDEVEYEAELRLALAEAVTYGLPAFASHPSTAEQE